MPDADFCSAVRLPFGNLSRRRDTEQISWGKLSRLPCTVAESTLRTLMDTDFAVRCPLVRCWRLISGFCPSTRTFDPCFLRSPSRDGSPCIITRPSPPSGWPEDFHLQAAEHAQHTTKPLARRALRVCPSPGLGVAEVVWLQRKEVSVTHLRKRFQEELQPSVIQTGCNQPLKCVDFRDSRETLTSWRCDEISLHARGVNAIPLPAKQPTR